MKITTVWVSIIIVILPFYAQSLRNLDWTSYKMSYGKSYGSQDATRQNLYQSRLATLQTMEASSLSYQVDINQFTDWTDQQLYYLTSSVKQDSFEIGNDFNHYKTEGDTVDLSSAGNTNWNHIMNSVKNQGNKCASGWAFALTAMAEATVYLKQEQTEDLSEQFLLQCTSSSSCNGGYLENGLNNLILKDGLPRENAFAYWPDGTYSDICSTDEKVFISPGDFTFYNLSDDQLKKLLKYGPVTVRVSSEGWIYYSGNIYECPSSNSNANHAVLLIGVQDSYWTIKNSWGTTWGERGYMRISRDQSKNCGIGKAVYVLSEPLIRIVEVVGVFITLMIVLL